jgi:hypothetical protein
MPLDAVAGGVLLNCSYRPGKTCAGSYHCYTTPHNPNAADSTSGGSDTSSTLLPHRLAALSRPDLQASQALRRPQLVPAGREWDAAARKIPFTHRGMVALALPELEPRCNRQPPSFFAPSRARHARSTNQKIIAQDHCGCWFRPPGDEAMDSRGAGQFHNAASPAHAVKAKIHSRIVAGANRNCSATGPGGPARARPGMAGGGQGGR